MIMKNMRISTPRRRTASDPICVPVVAMIAGLMFTGCHTSEGIKEDAEDVGEAIEDAAEKVKDAAEDAVE